jgi:hypothetical protein
VKLTPKEKRDLIRKYCFNMEKYMLEKLKEAPEEWDGRHLRNWFWMAAREQYEHNLPANEMADLKNEIIVRNL